MRSAWPLGSRDNPVLSSDTNILLYAIIAGNPRHLAACAWLESLKDDKSVLVSEFILGELYRLLRTPAVISVPFTAKQAVRVKKVPALTHAGVWSAFRRTVARCTTPFGALRPVMALLSGVSMMFGLHCPCAYRASPDSPQRMLRTSKVSGSTRSMILLRKRPIGRILASITSYRFLP